MISIDVIKLLLEEGETMESIEEMERFYECSEHIMEDEYE